MKSVDNDMVIVVAGFTVLFVSLAYPLMTELANKHEVRQVATRAVELKDEIMSSDHPAKVIQARVGNLVREFAPDTALAGVARADVAMPVDGLAAPSAHGMSDRALVSALEPSGATGVVGPSAGDGEEPAAQDRPRSSWAWDGQ